MICISRWVGPYRKHLSLAHFLGSMVVLTAGALWLFDCHTRMRVHPSSGGKGAVWLDWNVLSCEFRRSSV